MDDQEPTHADIVKRLDGIEETLAPIAETWEGVVAAGRLTRIIFRSIMWTASLVVIVMAAWANLTGEL